MSKLFVKKLTTLDFSFFCMQRGMIGETWIVDISLTGELNKEGMVFDFGHVKHIVKETIDNLVDHKLLLPGKNNNLSHKRENGNITATMHTVSGEKIQCTAPDQAILAVPVETICPQGITTYLKEHLTRYLPENITAVDLDLYTENINGAYYHYSHGLKKHNGDCQRIAHGHRSRFEIHLNQQRSREAELYWATVWKDIYIATEEDKIAEHMESGLLYFTFGYRAPQGYFEITLPSIRCCIIKTDTTVELLSAYVCDQMQLRYPECSIKVVLYEGLNKGAISCNDVMTSALEPALKNA